MAIYDYEATCVEELTFCEGEIIRVLKKHVHDVDDGWWEGEVNGQVGIFPSLVVEEIRDDGETPTPEEVGKIGAFFLGGGGGRKILLSCSLSVAIHQDITSPPGSAPPTFAPPPMPQFLSAAAQVIITQPTPETENPDDDDDDEEQLQDQRKSS